MQNSDIIWQLVDAKREAFEALSDRVFDMPEIAYTEFRSVAEHKAELERQGFRITENLAGIPTAIMGEAGEDGPVIAILGEYDKERDQAARRLAGEEVACALTPRERDILPYTSRFSSPSLTCGHSSFSTLNTIESRKCPSRTITCRRSTPSRTAPSLAIAAALRTLRASHLSCTRTQSRASNACFIISSLLSGFTLVPRCAEAIHVQPISIPLLGRSAT